METEFIYWRHDTSVGVRVEELSGGEDKAPKIWKEMALQVFGEQGGDRYRIIGHFKSGAPYLEDTEQRISVSHTPRFMVVASLPRTPESHLEEFNLRTAMGIDAERYDRAQALRVAERVMSAEEVEMMKEYAHTLYNIIPERPPLSEEECLTAAAVVAWTIKEALYKAALEEGIDFQHNLKIKKFPKVCSFPLEKTSFGEAEICRKDGERIPMRLFSYISEQHIVTLALSSKCATFKKG